jgi:hypothetical protein
MHHTALPVQQGAKSGSKPARHLANVQRGNKMAVAIASGRPVAPSPLPPSLPFAAGKRKRNADKEYMPGKGTAAWAFLICMFQGYKLGTSHYGKEELMELAEQSGLAHKPIHGINAAASVHAGNVHKTYNGWSCFTVRPGPCVMCPHDGTVDVATDTDGNVTARGARRDVHGLAMHSPGQLCAHAAPSIGIPIPRPSPSFCICFAHPEHEP